MLETPGRIVIFQPSKSCTNGSIAKLVAAVEHIKPATMPQQFIRPYMTQFLETQLHPFCQCDRAGWPGLERLREAPGLPFGPAPATRSCFAFASESHAKMTNGPLSNGDFAARAGIRSE